MQQRFRGFTLIELLMVVAILGILLSLLLPSLSAAREKAKFAVCKNNQKQIAIGYISYVNSNNGFYPAVFEHGNYIGWDDVLSPYMGLNYTQEQIDKNRITDPNYESLVLACPSDDVPRGNNGFKRSYNASEYSSNRKHIFNGLMGFKYPGEPHESINLAIVSDPANVVVSGETWAGWNRQGTGYDNHSKLILPYYDLLRTHTNDIIEGFFLCHDGKGLANFSMVDGHVKGINGKRIFDGQKNPGTNLCEGTMIDHSRDN